MAKFHLETDKLGPVSAAEPESSPLSVLYLHCCKHFLPYETQWICFLNSDVFLSYWRLNTNHILSLLSVNMESKWKAWDKKSLLQACPVPRSAGLTQHVIWYEENPRGNITPKSPVWVCCEATVLFFYRIWKTSVRSSALSLCPWVASFLAAKVLKRSHAHHQLQQVVDCVSALTFRSGSGLGWRRLQYQLIILYRAHRNEESHRWTKHMLSGASLNIIHRFW